MSVLVHCNSCDMFIEQFEYMYMVKFSRKKKEAKVTNFKNGNIPKYCVKISISNHNGVICVLFVQ